MSRIGKKPVDIPSGVTANISGATVSVKGPQGELSMILPRPITASLDNGKILLSSGSDTREGKSLHGLSRSLVANLVQGVSAGFRKDLEIQGVGFKAAMQGQTLSLMLGFSAPVKYAVPAGVKVSVDGSGTQLAVGGPDKQKVGDVAARIKSFYPAEPYKGKGVRFKGEYVRRKVGKTVA